MTSEQDQQSTGMRSDGELLGAFISDGDHAAFRQLVDRHHRFVIGVCYRILQDSHDAEDAFQATFLLLVKNANTIRKQQSVASWLYGVAYRISTRLARRRSRRQEQPLHSELTTAEDPLAELARRYRQHVIDDELTRLPVKYREPLALHYLAGRPLKEIAAQLGVSLGVLKGRMKRGRERLRIRLLQRGLTLSGFLATVRLSHELSAAATDPHLAETTLQSVTAGLKGTSSPTSGSEQTMQLAQQEMIAMTVTKPATLCASLLLASTIGFGILYGSSATDDQGIDDPFADSSEAVVTPRSVADKAPNLPISSDADDPARKRQSRPQLPADVIMAGLKSAHRNEVVIQEVLNKEVEFNFFETPLDSFAQTLQEKYGIPFWLDVKQLEKAGLGTDKEITSDLSGISLRSALRLVLGDLQMKYLVRGGILVITSAEDHDRSMATYLIRVDGKIPIQTEQLATMIKRLLVRDTWEENGGKGVILCTDEMLVIMQTQYNIEKILAFLNRLEAAHS